MKTDLNGNEFITNEMFIVRALTDEQLKQAYEEIATKNYKLHGVRNKVLQDMRVHVSSSYPTRSASYAILFEIARRSYE